MRDRSERAGLALGWVEQVATITGVSSTTGTSRQGRSVTFTARVTAQGATPVGVVQFFDNERLLVSRTLQSRPGFGFAEFVTAGLAGGQHFIEARYLGSPRCLASVSSVSVHTVRR